MNYSFPEKQYQALVLSLKREIIQADYDIPRVETWQEWHRKLLFNPRKKHDDYFKLWTFLWRNGAHPHIATYLTMWWFDKPGGPPVTSELVRNVELMEEDAGRNPRDVRYARLMVPVVFDIKSNTACGFKTYADWVATLDGLSPSHNKIYKG